MDSRLTSNSKPALMATLLFNGKRRSSSSSSTTTPATAAAAAAATSTAASTTTATTASSPCGACKFLRRKCTPGCVFAPHFSSEQGAAKFAAVHKVFGASNVSKLLLHLPPACRRDAVATVCYEAQARLSDPVYGCVATVLALQQQVAALQEELSVVQAHLMNTKLAIAASLQQNQQYFMNPLPPSNFASIVNITSNNSYPNITSDQLQQAAPPPAGSQHLFDFSTATTALMSPELGSGGEEEESGHSPVDFVDARMIY